MACVKNIAIVGAGGRSGKFIVESLAQSGKHQITAITRPDSTSTMPAGVNDVKKVDYTDHSSLVEALKGKEVLIITLNVFAPPDSSTWLVDAAIEAGIKWIIPNEWGVDLSKVDTAGDESPLTKALLKMRQYVGVKGAGRTQYIGIACSFWYEFSLAGSEARYGFDFEKKTLTLIDGGSIKLNTTTFPQVGRAVARLLALKEYPDNESDKSPCLSQFANGSVFISSFFIDQRDMFASVLRVTGESEDDWTISPENSKDRYEGGNKMYKEGNFAGFVLSAYVKVWFIDGNGAFNYKLHNELLGLPKEDLDPFTKRAIEMARAGDTNMPHVK